MTTGSSPLDQLPPPEDIHAHMGRLYRELALLRRLLRLAQSARTDPKLVQDRDARQEVHHVR